MKIINFLLRMVYGAVGIQMVNLALQFLGTPIMVGLNPVSLLTVGALGINGIGLLFGIAFYGTV